MAVLSTYFLKRRNLAIGLSISGSATGGVVFPLMARELLPKIGFGWTMRCIAFVQLTTLIVVNVFAKARVKPRRVGPIVEWQAWTEVPYSLFALSSFLVRFAQPHRHPFITNVQKGFLGCLFRVLLVSPYSAKK